MRSLKYIVHGQSLERDNSCDFSNIVAGSKKYLMLQFSFSKDFDDHRKVACFIKNNSIDYIPIINNVCFVPDELTEERKIYFYLAIVKGDQKIVTNKISIKQEVNAL